MSKEKTLLERGFEACFPEVKFVDVTPIKKKKSMSKIIFGTYEGFRVTQNVINVKNKDTQVTKPMTIYPKIHTWIDVKEENGKEIASKIEVADAPATYSNLEKHGRYKITCSDWAWNKIIRPSKAELIESKVDNNGTIQDRINAFKSNMQDRVWCEKQLTEFTHKDLVKYIMDVVEKAKQKAKEKEDAQRQEELNRINRENEMDHFLNEQPT